MAAASCCSASPSLDLTFLRPNTAANRLRFQLSTPNALRKPNHSFTTVAVRYRIRSVIRREEVIIMEKEDGKIDLGGNGSYNIDYVNGVESVKKVNGSVGGENGSLVKYVNGNGNGGMKIGEDVVEKKKKKKTIEEIGQEEAWFKRSGKGKVEVYV